MGPCIQNGSTEYFDNMKLNIESFISCRHFYAPLSNDRGILFLSCRFVCLSVRLFVVNFNIRYNF